MLPARYRWGHQDDDTSPPEREMPQVIAGEDVGGPAWLTPDDIAALTAIRRAARLPRSPGREKRGVFYRHAATVRIGIYLPRQITGSFLYASSQIIYSIFNSYGVDNFSTMIFASAIRISTVTRYLDASRTGFIGMLPRDSGFLDQFSRLCGAEKYFVVLASQVSAMPLCSRVEENCTFIVAAAG